MRDRHADPEGHKELHRRNCNGAMSYRVERRGFDASGLEGRRRAKPDERIEAAVAAADQPLTPCLQSWP
jgi:hypothetical protein